MQSRRTFLKTGAITGAALFAPWRLSLRHGLSSSTVFAAQSTQVPLAPGAIPQFVTPLPGLHTIVAGTAPIELRMTEFQIQVLPTGFPKTSVWGYLEPGQPASSSYIGPVIVATRGTPTAVKWVNNLGSAATTQVLAYRYSTDQTLHWADPLNSEANHCAHRATLPAFGSVCAQNYAGPVPAVAHLHGGEVPAVLDGGPDAWFTSDGLYHGHSYYAGLGGGGNTSVYRYPNSQEAAPIWFHDHTLGATRLNVHAGLAGGYLIVDPALDLPANLPGPADIIPLIIQDRMFDTAGQLFFPADSAGGILWTPNPDHPYWVPEFVGNTIVINGKTWPFKNVARKRYRFLFLNGSNARTYEMFLTDPVTKVNGPPMWVIGTDGGYLDTPVRIDPNNAAPGALRRLTMMPGERYEVIIDFNDPNWLALNPGFSGQLVLKNVAKTPFPGGTAPQGTTLGQMMKFIVGAPPAVDASYNPITDGPLRTGNQIIVRLANPAAGTLAAGVTPQLTRLLTLNEVMGMPQQAIDPVTGVMTAYPGGPLEVLVNNTKYGGQRTTGVTTDANGELVYTMEPVPDGVPDGSGNFVSERPAEGDTEVWEIVNITADAHPIHVHLVQFQVMNRQKLDVGKYNAAYAMAFPGGGYNPATGQPYPPGVYIPGFGPPRRYLPGANPLSGGKHGGNPDVVPYLKGALALPPASEAGWKDTVIAYPGEVTRIVVRFAPTDLATNVDPLQLAYPFSPDGGHGYVWHCHIVDHEDNEMMRPHAVTAKNVARSYVQGIDY